MDNKNFYTCCFTGHRPKNLPWRYNEKGLKFFITKHKLKKIIKSVILSGYNHFITGMALGIDILCAEIVLQYKNKYPHILLECAIPCKNQTQKWGKDSIKRYNKIFQSADKITYVSNSNYYNGCMQKRNKYMVDNSDLIIAVFNGNSGGTKQTIDYAKSKNINIKIIEL